MPKKSFSKTLVAVALLAVVILASWSHLSFAQAAQTDAKKISWLDCVQSPATCAIYYVMVLLNAIMSLFLSLGAMFVRLAMQFNDQIINSPAVQSGFGVSLSIANLGFVLGIIIIALATILRSQTYGIKQVLWKLVVAAISVNFALVISGIILNFSSQFTNYFVDAVNGSAGADYTRFVNQLTGTFDPQISLKPPPADNLADADCISRYAGSPTMAVICDYGKQFWEKSNNILSLKALDNFTANVLNMVLSVAFLFVITFTLFALAILLLIRYAYIGILLILAPLAWLMWIFPNFKHLFSKWWSNFLRWSFFPAIVTFFLYLAILTNTGVNKTNYLKKFQAPSGAISAGTISANNIQETAAATLTRTPEFIAVIGEKVILIVLALGGLFAANSLSIVGASVAMGAIKGAGKGFGTWAYKTGGRTAAGAAARVAQPKPKTAPGGGQYIPLTRWNKFRGKVAQRFTSAAQHSSVQGPGLIRSVWDGMKKGSGLFKGKYARMWTCQNCLNVAYKTNPNQIYSMKKPVGPCTQCGAPPNLANWT